jgi:hypothetical protein
MTSMMLGRGAVIVTSVAVAMTLSSQVFAQTPPPTKVSGVIHDYTAALDSFGPWQVVGDWVLAVNSSTGKLDFLASLSMVRSENPNRMSHTHHIQLSDGTVTALANGYRISGTASFTSNGSLAGFTGSPLAIEVTGSGAVPYANVTVTFGGAAAVHFGSQLKGVVTY